MCGITGAIWTEPQLAIDEPTLARMTEVLRHRGPDDAGIYRSELRRQEPLGTLPGVALGFRRLSIIDVAGGHQPLSNEDGSIWMVFNGEIYNDPELRRRLEGSGHHFRTGSDGETILHLYEDLGTDCFAHLNGMFAVALWDSNHGRLVLARDRLGKKPLYYREEPGRLTFASELKSLLKVEGAPREVDPGAVDEYLTYQYVPHPRCILSGYRKLCPGELVVHERGRLETRTYWRPDFARERECDEREAVEEVRRLLTSSVELRLRSDVPLGAFLSGGIDSSLIVALMTRMAGADVRTFTIKFPVAEYDESRHARLVADHLRTRHHEFLVTDNMLDILPRLVWHYDEPMADSSALPTWYVSQLTRQHVTVALSGDGGDELFAGYSRYRATWLAGWIDSLPPVRGVVASPLWRRMPTPGRQKSRWRQWLRFCEAAAQSPARRYLEWVTVFGESRRAALYEDEFVARLPGSDPAEFLLAAWARSGRRGPITAASLADLVTYLPCDLMCKVDIASMAHGLEVRQPFLDYRLVEYAASLPSRLKFRRGVGKRLLRAAFGDLLPRSIWRRPKMGFGVPLDHWFRGRHQGMLRDVLLSERATSRGLFRPDAVRALIDEHSEGRFNHSHRLWALLMLELWWREWIDLS